MARAVLITNPVAARARRDVATTVARYFRASGWSIEVAETTGPGDARRLADLAVRGGDDVVVVFGGDGTTMQAAAALVGTEVGLGLVPGGTGNLLAGNLRIPRAPVAAAQLIMRGRSRRIDLGRLVRADGVHYFGVACGVGAAARVMGETPAVAKRNWGVGGYLATLFRVLPEFRVTGYRITVDGQTWVAPGATALVLNCGELAPPLLRVRRGASFDDGELDLIVLAANTVWECARGAARVLANVLLDTGETAYLRYGRGREIVIESERPETVQFDGEVAGHTPVTATVVPGALRVMAPVA